MEFEIPRTRVSTGGDGGRH